MDPPQHDVEIEVDEARGEWMHHLPTPEGAYRSTFRGPITIWVTDRNPPHGPPQRMRILTPASVMIPDPRRNRRRRGTPPLLASSSSSASVAQQMPLHTPTVEIHEDRPQVPVPLLRGEPSARRTARMSVRRDFPRISWPRDDPMETSGDGQQARVREEDEEEEGDPSEDPSSAEGNAQWRPWTGGGSS